MNANELAKELESVPAYRNVPMFQRAATMLRQLQAENEKVNAEWVQAAMALGRAVQEIHEQKAEIESLKKKLNEAIDAEKDRRFE